MTGVVASPLVPPSSGPRRHVCWEGSSQKGVPVKPAQGETKKNGDVIWFFFFFFKPSGGSAQWVPKISVCRAEACYMQESRVHMYIRHDGC